MKNLGYVTTVWGTLLLVVSLFGTDLTAVVVGLTLGSIAFLFGLFVLDEEARTKRAIERFKKELE